SQFHNVPIRFFDQRQQGELMSRVTNDIDNINNSLNESVIQIFSSIVTLIATLSVMLWLSPLLTVITMTIVPLLIIGMRFITKRTGPLYKIQQQDLGEVNGFVEEIISGQQVVKIFSQEDQVIREFEEKSNQLQHSNFWALTFAGFIPKVMNTLNFLSFTLIAVAGAERVLTILDEQTEAYDETNARSIDKIKGHLQFENVSFSYGDSPVLHHIHFEAAPGEMVAFVGQTGAGKTTIINLISR